MKRFLMAMALLLAVLIVSVGALAEGQPKITFAAKTGEINGGLDYMLVLQADKAPEADLKVEILKDDGDEVIPVVIPAGEEQASVLLATEVVTERAKSTFTFLESDEYTAAGTHTLTLRPLPRVTFYQRVNLGSLGKNMSVRVECSNTANVLKDYNVFQLRALDGTVLAEKTWKPGNKQLTFSFEVTEELLGRQDMSVWLGDHKVSVEDGYGSLANTSKKVIVELAPEVPAMAIGIDCAYDDSKTDAILEVLEKHNVKVTFFMTGYFLRTYPEAAMKIFNAGHEIANHSNTHPHMKGEGEYNNLRQLMRPVEEVEAMMGVTPRLFRPPFGEFDSKITSLCRGEGMEVVMWTMSYKDSLPKYSVEKMMGYATTEQNYGPGSIVLCHLDGWCMPDTLDNGLTYYESLGLQTMPISALIYASGLELPPMPDAREALVYTDEYWPEWLRENLPEFAKALDK